MIKTALIGIGATLLLDLWVFILSLMKIKSLDYRYVGRWFGHMFNGTFVHRTIITSPPIRNESFIGWTAHYLIGTSFAFVLTTVYGTAWIDAPTYFPAFSVGMITLLAPLFIMQPAFGFGIASSALPHSNLLRLKSFATHTVYGAGLYGTALLLNHLV